MLIEIYSFNLQCNWLNNERTHLSHCAIIRILFFIFKIVDAKVVLPLKQICFGINQIDNLNNRLICVRNYALFVVKTQRLECVKQHERN